MKSDYNLSVFINCPFDNRYTPLFDALVFTVVDCGFIARCSKELNDADDVRLSKITTIINGCKFGIHDISRAKIDRVTKLARFNMPFELGIFVGAKNFGDKANKEKKFIIFDAVPYRYRYFISDIAGQDIKIHENNPKIAILETRNWLSTKVKRRLPAGNTIWNRYGQFKSELPKICKQIGFVPSELIFPDYVETIKEWLLLNTV